MREFTAFTKRAQVDSGGGSLHTSSGAQPAPQSQATLPVRQATMGNSPPVVSNTPETDTASGELAAKPVTPTGAKLKTTNWGKP